MSWALVFVTIAAGADAPPRRVVLVTMKECCKPIAAPHVEALLPMELTPLGYEIVQIAGRSADARERRIELGVLAEERQAVAAVRVVKETGTRGLRVELWMRRWGAGHAFFKALGIDEAHSHRAAELASLSIVEILDAHLDPPNLRTPKPVEEQPPDRPPPPPPVARMPRSSISLAVGLGALGSIRSDALDPAFTGEIAFHWRISPPWRLWVDGTLAMTQPTFPTPGGEGRVRPLLARAWGGWDVLTLGDFEMTAGIGAGALVLTSSGQPEDGYEATGLSRPYAYGGMTLLAALQLENGVALRLLARVGTLSAQVLLTGPGDSRVRFGPVVWESILALGYRFDIAAFHP